MDRLLGRVRRPVGYGASAGAGPREGAIFVEARGWPFQDANEVARRAVELAAAGPGSGTGWEARPVGKCTGKLGRRRPRRSHQRTPAQTFESTKGIPCWYLDLFDV